MNKLGQLGETMLLPAVLFVMVIIAVGMVVGVSLVLGSDYEFRKVDSKILNYQLKECIIDSSSGNIRENVFSNCNINKNVIENNKMFFKICEGINAQECSSSSNSLVMSGSNFESCFFIAAKENYEYPKCTISEFSLDGKHYSIISGSNQEMRRIKL